MNWNKHDVPSISHYQAFIVSYIFPLKQQKWAIHTNKWIVMNEVKHSFCANNKSSDNFSRMDNFVSICDDAFLY